MQYAKSSKATSLGQQPTKRTNKPRPPVSSINNHQSKKKCQCHFGKKTCPNQHIAISRSNKFLRCDRETFAWTNESCFFFLPCWWSRPKRRGGGRVATRFDKSKQRRESCSVLNVAQLALAPCRSALDANATQSILDLILRKGGVCGCQVWVPYITELADSISVESDRDYWTSIRRPSKT